MFVCISSLIFICEIPIGIPTFANASEFWGHVGVTLVSSPVTVEKDVGSWNLSDGRMQRSTLPETNKAPRNGWLED